MTLGVGFFGHGHERLAGQGVELPLRDGGFGRRYSDKGITELARIVASEWTIEASPSLEVFVLDVTPHRVEMFLRTTALPVIEMQKPLVELVESDGTRSEVRCDWRHEPDESHVVWYASLSAPLSKVDSTALSIRWQGELWPRFTVSLANARAMSAQSLEISVLGARVQILMRRESPRM